jgi:hypothetical protein
MMGTAAEHEEKAIHHLEFLAEISDRYPDWLATVAFYAAVELVERLFSQYGVHSRSHEDRNRTVLRRYPSIARAYKVLYGASFDARYGGISSWMPIKEVHRELIDRHLNHIRSFVESHAGGSQP